MKIYKNVLLVLAGVVCVHCTPLPIYTVERERMDPPKNNGADLAAPDKSLDPAILSSESDTKTALVKEIDTWLGTPYAFGKAVKQKGTDCSGFVQSIFLKVLEVKLPREANQMYTLGKSVEHANLKLGDLVFFEKTYRGAKGASHVGIFVGDGKIAHASTTSGVTYSDLSEPYYKKHFLGCRRVLDFTSK